MNETPTSELQRIEREIDALKQRKSNLLRLQPPEVVDNYAFEGWDGPTTLSDLFRDNADLIVVHNMGVGCTYCTLWADGFNGLAPHIEDRAAFVVVSPNPVQVQRKFSTGRGWKFRMVSDGTKAFTGAMGYLDKDGDPNPGVSTFSKASDGSISRQNTAELGPLDDFCALWPMFAMLKDGPNAWEPKFGY